MNALAPTCLLTALLAGLALPGLTTEAAQLETSARVPGFAASQEPAPVQEPATSQESGAQQLLGELASQGVRLDLARQLIEIDVSICQDREPLEYLLVTDKGKDHEALLQCLDVSAEALNTAMLLLGVEKGQNAGFEKLDPAPSEEELAEGASLYKSIPPQGDGFYLYVSWEVEAADGKSETRWYRAEDLVVNVAAERTYQRGPWVYLGSRFIRPHKDAEEFFAAEGEGNLISVCYFDPANHLVTGSDPEAGNQYVWYPNIFLMPERGSSARLLFSREMLETPPPRLGHGEGATAE